MGDEQRSDVDGADPGSPVDEVTPPERVPGWHGVEGEPMGTLAWWDGQRDAAVVRWQGDHWDYEIGDWRGRNPSRRQRPSGASDPRAFGWWQAPDGAWHGPPPGGRLPLGHPAWVVVGWIVLAALVVLALGMLWSLKADYSMVVETTSYGYGTNSAADLPSVATGFWKWAAFGLAALACGWSLARAVVAHRRRDHEVRRTLRALGFACLATAGGLIVLAQDLVVDCLIEDPGSITGRWSSEYTSTSCGIAASARAAAVWRATDRGATALVVVGVATAMASLWLLYRTRSAATGARSSEVRKSPAVVEVRDLTTGAPAVVGSAVSGIRRWKNLAVAFTVTGIAGMFLGMYGNHGIAAAGAVVMTTGIVLALLVVAGASTPEATRRSTSMVLVVGASWLTLLSFVSV